MDVIRGKKALPSKRFEEHFPLPDLDPVLEHIRWMTNLAESRTSQTQMAEHLSQPGQPVSQSTISRILSSRREASYNEIAKLWNWFMAKQSRFDPLIRVRDLVEPPHSLITATLDEELESVANKMLENGFSQLPVFENDKFERCYGILTDLSVLEAVKRYGSEKARRMLISELQDLIIRVPRVDEEEQLWRIAYILEFVYATLVVDKEGTVRNILTRNDLLKLAVLAT